MRLGGSRLLWLLLVLCSLAACRDEKTPVPTQTIVLIYAQPEVARQTDALTVVVAYDDNASYTENAGREDDTLGWPYKLVLEPRHGDAERFEVTATARDADGDFVSSVRAISGHVHGKQIVLELLLEDGCIGQRCESDETCQAGRCTSANVDPDDLPQASAEAGVGKPNGGTANDGAAGQPNGGTGGTGDAGIDMRMDAGRDSGAGSALQARCGDGVVSGDETCDTGIASGQPGACPTECPALGVCLPRELQGNGCSATCVVNELTCSDGDDCCPASCNDDTDSDCSQRCGDGMVEASEGETCEPGSDSDPCPASCDDDDACTMDVLEGNPDNCNVVCTHVPLGIGPGDGCCPVGANANSDEDCLPECGNGVKEEGEDCDGTDGCNASCKRVSTTPTQAQCIAERVAGSPDPACEECQCLHCTELAIDCLFDMDTSRRAQCENLHACSLKADCVGVPCYCGPDVALCGGILGRPTGPCVDEFEAAAGGSTDPLVVLQRMTDTDYALGRWNALAACAATQCPDVCP